MQQLLWAKQGANIPVKCGFQLQNNKSIKNEKLISKDPLNLKLNLEGLYIENKTVSY